MSNDFEARVSQVDGYQEWGEPTQGPQGRNMPGTWSKNKTIRADRRGKVGKRDRKRAEGPTQVGPVDKCTVSELVSHRRVCRSLP